MLLVKLLSTDEEVPSEIVLIETEPVKDGVRVTEEISLCVVLAPGTVELPPDPVGAVVAVEFHPEGWPDEDVG